MATMWPVVCCGTNAPQWQWPRQRQHHKNSNNNNYNCDIIVMHFKLKRIYFVKLNNKFCVILSFLFVRWMFFLLLDGSCAVPLRAWALAIGSFDAPANWSDPFKLTAFKSQFFLFLFLEFFCGWKLHYWIIWGIRANWAEKISIVSERVVPECRPKIKHEWWYFSENGRILMKRGRTTFAVGRCEMAKVWVAYLVF